ncbi:MAG TPA: GNAT family N-acetyltransferase [Mycobacteriales bacterium]|nr:GNAT family N-acetyltransferase [Mycobacteriales bacterium]
MTLRRATPADAAELTDLRAAMYVAWGDDPSGQEWRDSATAMFERRLRDEPESFVAYVVEDGSGRIVASGVGWVTEHLPNPHNLTGLRGHIASMSTLEAVRGQGHGRAVIDALLAWFDQRDILRVDLVATPMGEPLYRSVGFAEHGNATALVRRPPPRAE